MKEVRLEEFRKEARQKQLEAGRDEEIREKAAEEKGER